MVSYEELASEVPALRSITATEVANKRGDVTRQLVVLDDDPTGTQSVADLPVLNSWSTSDLKWALGTGAPVCVRGVIGIRLSLAKVSAQEQ